MTTNSTIAYLKILFGFLFKKINRHNPKRKGIIAARVADNNTFKPSIIIANVWRKVRYLIRKNEHRNKIAHEIPYTEDDTQNEVTLKAL